MPNFFTIELICSCTYSIFCIRKSQEARKPFHPLFGKDEKKSFNATNLLNYAKSASVVYEQSVFCNVYDVFAAKNMLSNLTWASIHTHLDTLLNHFIFVKGTYPGRCYVTLHNSSYSLHIPSTVAESTEKDLFFNFLCCN